MAINWSASRKAQSPCISEELKEQYGVTFGYWLKGTGNDEFMKMRLPEAVTVPAVSVI